VLRSNSLSSPLEQLFVIQHVGVYTKSALILATENSERKSQGSLRWACTQR